MAIPTYAFAATGDVLNYNDMAVVWGPNPVGRWGSGDSDDNGVIVVANSMYNAAIVTCGYDVLDSRLTHDVKAKLSNASTGGNFYTFAQTFECFQGQDGYNYPSWNRSATGVVDTIASLYGASNVWWSVYDSYLLQSAKEDLEAVLNGQNLGGGSGELASNLINMTPFDASLYQQYTPVTFYDSIVYKLGTQSYYNRVKSNGQLRQTNIATEYNISITNSFMNGLNREVQEGYKYILFVQSNRGGTYSLSCILVKDKSQYDIQYQNGYTYAIRVNGDIKIAYSVSSISVSDWPNDVDSLSTVFRYSYGGSFVDRNTSGLLIDTYSTAYAIMDMNADLPTQWPNDPTPTPVEPPEVPEPPTTTPPTQPTPPTSPTPPTYQPQPVYVTSTFTADLQGIIDAMDEHCQHIQNALYQQSKNLYEDFTTYMSDKYADLKLVLDGNFGYIGETIDDGLEDLKDYLWDLFKWLKENMEFSFTAPEYDDSSVLSWLKKIYSKMGTGIRSKPVDPVVDPVGAWNWLEQLIQGILGALSNAVGGLTGTVGELFNGIKDKFPFSIPWDLAAILALFDAAPVTPQATIDYTIFEDGPVAIPVHWDINMHYLDDTMGTVRAMEDIVFCFYLLLKTDWLSNIFDGIGDYLGGRYRVATRS